MRNFYPEITNSKISIIKKLILEMVIAFTIKKKEKY